MQVINNEEVRWYLMREFNKGKLNGTYQTYIAPIILCCALVGASFIVARAISHQVIGRRLPHLRTPDHKQTMRLVHASKEHRANHKIVTEAVKQNGFVLKYASEERKRP